MAKKQLLNESYKDLEKLYGDLSNILNPEELKYAYNLFQTESGIKNIIKKELNLSLGTIEKAIVAKYPQPLDFINSVFQAKDQLGIDKKIQVQKTQVGQQFHNELKENETDDFYIIPCRTFEQAHKAANSYTGNLEIMSRDKIKDKYSVNVPAPATFYKTNKSPVEFLEFMKSAPFFMAPSWCIAGGKNFWDMYDLDSINGEPCRCYIIISKRYPNVRFCITKRVKETAQLIPSECDNKKCTFERTEIFEIDEFRDPWQTGGKEKITTAKNMFCSIKFINETTKNKIFKLLQPLQVFLCKKTYEYEKITDGRCLFTDLDWRVFDKKLDHLEDASDMFVNCKNLTQFTSDLPNLVYADGMFSNCENLTQFTSDLPNLRAANYMFWRCKNLKQFTSNLPNLRDAGCTFANCKTLTQFTSDLPNLFYAERMFSACENLTQFTSDLPNLTNGKNMFFGCTLDEKSVLNILKTIHDRSKDNKPTAPLHIGTVTNFKHSLQIAELLKTTVPIKPGDYTYKGWKIEVQ